MIVKRFFLYLACGACACGLSFGIFRLAGSMRRMNQDTMDSRLSRMEEKMFDGYQASLLAAMKPVADDQSSGGDTGTDPDCPGYSHGDASQTPSSGDEFTGGSPGADGKDPTKMPPEWAIVDEDGTYVYMIQRGDTLCRISALTRYSVDELAAYNQIANVHWIYAGSSLRVPNMVHSELVSMETEQENRTR